MKEQLMTLKRHILTGTSHMIPFIVAGDTLFFLSMIFNLADATTSETGQSAGPADVGFTGLTLFVPALGGYIAYSIVDGPDLMPSMIDAYLANSTGAGFPGGMAAGLITGAIVEQLKRIKLPISLRTLGSISVYPLAGTLITGGIVVWDIDGPIATLMQVLTSWLFSLGDVGKVPLVSILGTMTAFNMGGPISKVATLFAQTQMDTLPHLMGDVGVAICTSPIGMRIATFLAPKKYNAEEKEAGKAVILMGYVGITEEATSFAVNGPLRATPSLIVDAVVGNIVPFLVGVLNHTS